MLRYAKQCLPRVGSSIVWKLQLHNKYIPCMGQIDLLHTRSAIMVDGYNWLFDSKDTLLIEPGPRSLLTNNRTFHFFICFVVRRTCEGATNATLHEYNQLLSLGFQRATPFYTAHTRRHFYERILHTFRR